MRSVPDTIRVSLDQFCTNGPGSSMLTTRRRSPASGFERRPRSIPQVAQVRRDGHSDGDSMMAAVPVSQAYVRTRTRVPAGRMVRWRRAPFEAPRPVVRPGARSMTPARGAVCGWS